MMASLARAHIVALSRADAVNQATRGKIRKRVQQVAPQTVWLELEHQPTGYVNSLGKRMPLDVLRGQRVAAFCGIGNPGGFRHTLASCGLDVAAFRALPDHCAYPSEEIARLASWVSELSEACPVICTRKDLVKLSQDDLAGLPLWALEIQLSITTGQAELCDVLSRLSGDWQWK